MTYPKLSLEKKKALLQETFAAVSTPLRNTLLLLLERHRIDIVPELAEQFIELVNEARGVAEATAYSARPLTEEEKRALSEVFAKKSAKRRFILKILSIQA